MMWMLVALAWADEPNWSTDRGGIGDATGTPGQGHVLLEAAVGATVREPMSVGTRGLVGRIGLTDGLELRLRLPDVSFTPDVQGGQGGVGFKVGPSSAGAWAASIAPELRIDSRTGDLSGYLSANGSFAEGLFTSWVTGVTTWDEGAVGLFLGGALGVTAGAGLVYVNAGRQVNTSSLVGAGGLWQLSSSAQVDVGLDFVVADEAVFTPSLGLVLGF